MNLSDDKPNRHLLLVDDEESILQALRRMLRRDGYVIHLASSGEQGLAILEKEPIGVIVSDQRMPVMTGSEFLSKVKEKYPETVRMVLSGYTELNSITEAINRGAIYKFLTKPWDDELLRAHVAEAFARFEMKAENARLLALNKAMIDAVPDVLILVDVATGRVVSANTAAGHLLGYAADRLTEKHIADVEPLPMDLCYWAEIAQGGFRPLQAVETEYRTAIGECIPVRKTTVAVAGCAGRVLVLAQDIRRERAVESSLERINAEMAAIFEATSDGLLVIDSAGRLVRMNRRLADYWAFPPERVTASGGHDLVRWIAQQSTRPGETESELFAALARPEAGAGGAFARVNRDHVEWCANPLRVGGEVVGQVLGFSATPPVAAGGAQGAGVSVPK